MRTINKIIIHCSDSHWGNAASIRQWHLERGFDDIGYHFLILNGYPSCQNYKDRRPIPDADGMLENGRDLELPGAHTQGNNENSIALCLVGVTTFSGKQIQVLVTMVRHFMARFGLKAHDVFGHYEFDAAKSCPNLDMNYVRGMLK